MISKKTLLWVGGLAGVATVAYVLWPTAKGPGTENPSETKKSFSGANGKSVGAIDALGVKVSKNDAGALLVRLPANALVVDKSGVTIELVGNGRIKVSSGTGGGTKKCFDTVNGVYVPCPSSAQ